MGTEAGSSRFMRYEACMGMLETVRQQTQVAPDEASGAATAEGGEGPANVDA